jgi:chromosome segregation ATPase
VPGSQSFNVVAEGTETMAAADRAALSEFQRKVSALQRAVTGASDAANSANMRINLMRRAAQEASGSTPALMNEVKALDEKIDGILHALRGGRDNTDIPPPSISQRVNTIAQRIRLSALRPTQSQIENYNLAADEFKPVLARLKTLLEVEMPKLEKALDAAGAPWTPGRLPEWSDK